MWYSEDDYELMSAVVNNATSLSDEFYFESTK